MEVITHANGLQVSTDLRNFINKKVSKVENYIGKLTSIDVYLKLENHSQIKAKTSEIKVNIPGGTIFSSETANTFEEATDNAVSSLIRQAKKYKEKKRS